MAKRKINVTFAEFTATIRRLAHHYNELESIKRSNKKRTTGRDADDDKADAAASVLAKEEAPE